jgi:hypothetical protein
VQTCTVADARGVAGSHESVLLEHRGQLRQCLHCVPRRVARVNAHVLCQSRVWSVCMCTVLHSHEVTDVHAHVHTGGLRAPRVLVDHHSLHALQANRQRVKGTRAVLQPSEACKSRTGRLISGRCLSCLSDSFSLPLSHFLSLPASLPRSLSLSLPLSLSPEKVARTIKTLYGFSAWKLNT